MGSMRRSLSMDKQDPERHTQLRVTKMQLKRDAVHMAMAATGQKRVLEKK